MSGHKWISKLNSVVRLAVLASPAVGLKAANHGEMAELRIASHGWRGNQLLSDLFISFLVTGIDASRCRGANLMWFCGVLSIHFSMLHTFCVVRGSIKGKTARQEQCNTPLKHLQFQCRD